MFVIVLFIFVVIILYWELFGINFKDMLVEFSKINCMFLVLLFIGGGVLFVILLMYDVILFRVLKMDIFLGKVLRVSYIINVLNVIVGFGGFIGVGVRVMVYKNYMYDKKKLVYFIFLIFILMLIGLSLLLLLIVFYVFDVFLILDKIIWVRWVLYVVLFFLLLFIIYLMVRLFDKNNCFVGLYCILVLCVEWLVVVVVLYFCGVIVDVYVLFMFFIVIFIIVVLLGLVSFIFGGFGVFDLVVLLGFKILGVFEEKVLLMLFLYCFVYYFVLVIIVLILLLFEFGILVKKYIEGFKYFIFVKDVMLFLMFY